MSKSFMAKLLVVLAGFSVFIPATAAHAAPELEPADGCAKVASDLRHKLGGAQEALNAEQPDADTAKRLLRQAARTVTGAQSEGCLPATDDADVKAISEAAVRGDNSQKTRTEEGELPVPAPSCESATEEVLGGLLGSVTALLGGLLPTVLDVVTGLLATVADLLGVCLPLPTTPPLPTPPLPTAATA